MLKLQAFDQGQKPLDLTGNNGLPMKLSPSDHAAASVTGVLSLSLPLLASVVAALVTKRRRMRRDDDGELEMEKFAWLMLPPGAEQMRQRQRRGAEVTGRPGKEEEEEKKRKGTEGKEKKEGKRGSEGCGGCLGRGK